MVVLQPFFGSICMYKLLISRDLSMFTLLSMNSPSLLSLLINSDKQGRSLEVKIYILHTHHPQNLNLNWNILPQELVGCFSVQSRIIASRWISFKLDGKISSPFVPSSRRATNRFFFVCLFVSLQYQLSFCRIVATP